MAKYKHGTRYLKRRILTPGMMPGTLIPDPEALNTRIYAIAYNNNEVTKHELEDAVQLKDLIDRWSVLWINVIGLGDIKKISAIGELFDLHPLAMEDTVNTHQRAKIDDYKTHQFIVTHLATLDTSLKIEQVSIFLGKNFVISFSQSPPACFEMVENRLNKPDNRFRTKGPDYLVYALLDAIIDCYFPVLEGYSDQLDTIEDEVILAPRPDLISKMHELKRVFTIMKRDIWQQRDMLNNIYRETTSFIQQETSIYFRDCYDHTIQIIELLETQRERCTSLTDVYLSSMANRLNEIMKVLTIISTVFMPLGFFTGLWGMNFNHEASPWNMPELTWRYGYPMALTLMFITATGFIVYFWKRKWLSFK